MLPSWMQEIFGCCPCSGCRARLTSDDIEIVGVRRPEEFEAWRAEPVFVICLACRGCGARTNVLTRQSLPAALEGVTAFVKVIERECEGKQPLIKIPGLTEPAALPPTEQSAPTKHPSVAPLRPSRRRGQPVTPPSQAEIRAFLNRLKKASFKRGTKGFKAWMKGFGIDADAPEDADSQQK